MYLLAIILDLFILLDKLGHFLFILCNLVCIFDHLIVFIKCVDHLVNLSYDGSLSRLKRLELIKLVIISIGLFTSVAFLPLTIDISIASLKFVIKQSEEFIFPL